MSALTKENIIQIVSAYFEANIDIRMLGISIEDERPKMIFNFQDIEGVFSREEISKIIIVFKGFCDKEMIDAFLSTCALMKIEIMDFLTWKNDSFCPRLGVLA